MLGRRSREQRALGALLALLAAACGHRASGGGGADSSVPGVAAPTGDAAVAAHGGGAVARANPEAGLATLGPRRQWPSCTGMAAIADDDGGVSPYDDTCVIDEQHGVFADATHGDDQHADGSRDYPYQTLAAAIAAAAAAGKDVYACAGTYAGPVQLGSAAAIGLRLFGGLSCDTFLPDPSGPHSVVHVEGPGPALAIGDTHSIEVARFDFEVVPSDHAAGTSYVAATIAHAHKVVLQDVALRAAPGEDGADGAAPPPQPMAGAAGSPGANACAANPNPGGAVVANLTCPSQPYNAGGSGGDGAIGTSNGGSGSWLGGSGNGGVGESPGTGWSCVAGSGLGYAQGTPYPGQPGAGAQGFGALIGVRFSGFSGQSGSAGSSGNGGAGGGGALAPASCPALGTAVGASGGGGGAAGCGGKGGKGGASGGSSIGLIAVDAELHMLGGSIAYGDGGKGGNGAPGQLGGKGGAGGAGGKGSSGSHDGCPGTAGSDGGDGGPGGGGNGGHAIGVLYLDQKPSLSAVSGEADVAKHKGGAPGGPPAGVDPSLVMMSTGTMGVSEFVHAM